MVSTVVVEGYCLLQHTWGPQFLTTSPPWAAFVCRCSSQTIMPSTLVTSVGTRPKNVQFSSVATKSGLGGQQKACLHWTMRYHARRFLSGSLKGWKVSGLGTVRSLWGQGLTARAWSLRPGQGRQGNSWHSSSPWLQAHPLSISPQVELAWHGPWAGLCGIGDGILQPLWGRHSVPGAVGRVGWALEWAGSLGLPSAVRWTWCLQPRKLKHPSWIAFNHLRSLVFHI